MNNAQQSAHPIFLQNGLSHDCHVDTGLTKLEYFAGLAMQGFLSSSAQKIYTDMELAIASINTAKALLKQLEDENNKG